jgi:hypothetical protein
MNWRRLGRNVLRASLAAELGAYVLDDIRTRDLPIARPERSR